MFLKAFLALRRLALGAGLFLCMALVLAGCSKPPGNVSGKVRYKNKDLPGGTVVFTCQTDNDVKTANIESDGSYKAVNLPAGPAKVAVITSKPLEMPAGGPMSAAKMGGSVEGKFTGDPKIREKGGAANNNPMMGRGKKTPTGGTYMAIPDHYADPDRSGLTITVKSGNNKYDIDLEDK